jgi:hypothetical protein
LPLVISIGVLLVMTAVFVRDWTRLNQRDEDTPPVIEFTWSPLGPVDLKEMRGFLKMADDYALDFTTYRMEIRELGRSYDLPIEGLIGREYEQPISLGLLASDPGLTGRDRITIKFSIKDDRGQAAELERIIHLKPAAEAAVRLEAR